MDAGGRDQRTRVQSCIHLAILILRSPDGDLSQSHAASSQFVISMQQVQFKAKHCCAQLQSWWSIDGARNWEKVTAASHADFRHILTVNGCPGARRPASRSLSEITSGSPSTSKGLAVQVSLLQWKQIIKVDFCHKQILSNRSSKPMHGLRKFHPTRMSMSSIKPTTKPADPKPNPRFLPAARVGPSCP